jgi:hypothetical protein
MGKSIDPRQFSHRNRPILAAAIAGMAIFAGFSTFEFNYFLSGYLILLTTQLSLVGIYYLYRRQKLQRVDRD